MYPHYFLDLMAPVILLAVQFPLLCGPVPSGLAMEPVGPPTIRPTMQPKASQKPIKPPTSRHLPPILAGWLGHSGKIVALWSLLLVWPLAIDPDYLIHHVEDASVSEAAGARLRALEPAGKASLLVLNRGLYAYLTSGLLPASRYFHHMHLLCDFPTPEGSPLAEAFAAKPSYVLVADMKLGRPCEREDLLSAAAKALAADYVPLEMVRGTGTDSATIYRRKSG